MRKSRLLLLLIICLTSISNAFAQDPELPAPSPLSTVSQKVGLATVKITYSRPSVKGRIVFGNLVPFNEVWRTGANQCTQIEFDRDILINNEKVAAGKYALFTIPTEGDWTIILNKDAEQWGSYGYKKEDDVLRFMVKQKKSVYNESLIFSFTNVTMQSAKIEMAWENTGISFDIAHDYISEAQQNIKDAIANVEQPYGLYDASAEFYLDNNMDAVQALEWSKKSVAMQERYWNLYNLSRAYAANNMYKEAVETAERSLKLATEAKNTGMAESNTKNIEEWKKKI